MAYKGRVRPTIALTAADIAADAVGSSEIAAGAVDTAEIATDAVTANEIAAGAVAASEIASTFDISSKTVTLPAASVTAHVTAFDDTAVRNDIATLALHSAIADNKVAYNLSNAFIDQFQDSSGLDVLTTSQRHASEYMMVLAGSEQHIPMTVSDAGEISATNFSTGTPAGYKIYDGVGGSTGSNADNSSVGPSGGDGYITYDFGSGNEKTLSKTITYGRAGGGWGGYHYYNGSQTFTVLGSNDNSTFTDIGGSVTFTDTDGQNPKTLTHTSTTAYRYFKTTLTNFDGNEVHITELEHFHVPDEPTGNYTSATQTALSSVSTMGIVVLYKNQSGTATLNTDLVAQVSANGGTNYSSATIVAGGTFSSGINIAAVSGVSVTAGTTPKYKISFANQSSGSKETQVHGVALLY